MRGLVHPSDRGVNRSVPARIDERISVPLDVCPHCGGPVADCRPQIQFIEEIPVVQLRVIELTTHY